MESPITHLIDGKYIREWLMLGPFFPDDLEKDFLADVGGEVNIEPKEGDTVTTADGKMLTWQRYESETDIIEFLDTVGYHEYATAYAFCVLQSESAGGVSFGVRNDDDIAVWINGQRAYCQPIWRDLALYEDVFEANLKAGENRCLVKVTNELRTWGFAMRTFPSDCAVIAGIITDEEGNPLNHVDVRLEQDGEDIARTQTDEEGNYRLGVYSVRGTYELSATSGVLGDWQLGIPLREGERRFLNLTLEEAISIEGTLLMLDDETPHAAVFVQVVHGGEEIATTSSNTDGKYWFINLKPGRYQLRCYTLGGYVYYGGEEKTVLEPLDAASLKVERSKTLENIDFRFPQTKKGTWKHYTAIDGLASMAVHAIHQDLDGYLWFGSRSHNTGGGGISRYDGKEFKNFTTKDGL